MQSLYEGILDRGLDPKELELPLLLQHEINNRFRVREDELVTGASLSHSGNTLVLQVNGITLARKSGFGQQGSGFNLRTDAAIRSITGTSRKIKKIHLNLDSKIRTTNCRNIHIADGTTNKGIRDWKLTSTVPHSILYLYGENRCVNFKDWKLECECLQDDAVITVYGGREKFYMEDMDLKSDHINLYGGHGYLKNCQLQASHSVELVCAAGIHEYLAPEAVEYLMISDSGIIRSMLYYTPARMRKLETQYHIEDIIAETSILKSLHPRTPRLIFSSLGKSQPISLMFVRDPRDFTRLYDPENYVTLADGWYLASVII